MSDVVDRVLAALNERNLDAFVACYATTKMRARYSGMFERFPELHVEPGWRTTVGDFVVQEETVTGRQGHERHVAVYLLADDLIARERLIA